VPSWTLQAHFQSRNLAIVAMVQNEGIGQQSTIGFIMGSVLNAKVPDYIGIRAQCDGIFLFKKSNFSFDELLVAFYTPDTLHVYRHDCHFGVSERGRDTKLIGHAIHICGPCGVEDWQTAEVIILGKLNSSSNDCQHIASLPLEDPQFADALKKCTSPSLHHANAMRTNVPLIHHTAPFRVLVIEQVVFALDRMVSRDGVSFTRHIGDELTFNGKQRRGNHQQTCDW